MAKFFLGHLPDVLYHGTTNPAALEGPCLAASQSGRWGRLPWPSYERDFDEARMAYANVVWEGLGMCEKGRPNVPEWAKNIRSFRQLGDTIGILFVTDNPQRAEALYGPAIEIDMTHPSILDVVADPNAQTHNAWILVLKAGEPLPLRQPAPAMAP